MFFEREKLYQAIINNHSSTHKRCSSTVNPLFVYIFKQNEKYNAFL